MKFNLSNKTISRLAGGILAFAGSVFGLEAQAQMGYTFTNCGAIGQFGPSQAQANTAYASTNLNGQVSVINGIQYWIVPSSGAYSIEAYGAQGYGSYGGRGAHMYGEFNLTAGDTLKILVGQKGEPPVGSGTNQYGGGGGSFITTMNNTPLVVAGGGGGSWASAFTSVTDASTSTSGNTGAGAGATGGSGGANGTGGLTNSSADGGGGLLTNGTGTANGKAFVNGGAGGIATSSGGHGGFGGGGGASSWDNRRGGGGGGYSGGGGSHGGTTGFPEAGGGGSYNAGLNQVNLAGVQLSHGQVVITPLETFPNDAGISAVTSPTAPVCAGTYPVIATVVNYGNNQITPVTIKWSINGVLQSDSILTTTLDTASGTGVSSLSLNLGNVTISGPTVVKVWTTQPNNTADTVNSNDTAMFVGAPSLGGVYTLGSSATADFPTFAAFMTALSNVGICDSVIVEVEDGTYNENLTLPQVPNMSSQNSVTFRGQSQNSSLAKLTAASGTTVTFSGGDYFSFEHMTIENTSGANYVIEFQGGSDYNRFEDCYVRNNDSTTTATTSTLVYSGSGTLNNYNKFYNNTFKNGSYGFYWWGSGTTSLEIGNEFVGNEFIDQYYYANYFYYELGLIFDQNSIHSKANYTSGRGVMAYYCDNSKFTRNHVYTEPGDIWPLYGMYIAYCDATSFNSPVVIANNVISIGDTANTTTTYYGLCPYYSTLADVVNNTVILRGGGSSSQAMYYYNSDFGRFANNIMANYSQGYSLYEYSADVLIGDNNVYYTEGPILFYRDNTWMNLTAWQNASGEDEHSMQMDPGFNNLMTGTFCNDTLDNIGQFVASTTIDFNGISRSSVTPDPGAYEFFGLSGVNLGPDTTLCQGEFVLSVGDSTLVNNVSWVVTSASGTNTSNAPTYVVSSSQGAQTFNISASVSTSCGSNSDNAIITLVAPANLADSTHICYGASTTLSANGGPSASVSWFPTNEMTNSITVSTPGYYAVSKMEEGCESHSSTIVTQSEGISVLDIEPCAADMPVAISVAIENGTGYSWSGGNNPNSATNVFTATGDYAVTATDSYGCISSDSFSINVIDVPTAVVSETHAGTVYSFSSANSSNVGSNASYLWQFGDGAVSTLANPVHNYNWGNPGAPPAYNVTLTITNDCGVDSKTKTITVDVLGIETAENNIGYVVYPNPTSNVWNVKFEQANEASIEVIDIAGRVIMTTNNLSGNIVTIDASNLPSGNYILKVMSNDQIAYSRVSVTK